MSDDFRSLKLQDQLTCNLEELGFSSMTPIQQVGLPLVLEGHDLIAQAKTGSGKTAVFALGILNALNIADRTIHSLILCPTRELAEQVAQEIRTLGRMLPNIKILAITGGQSEFQQTRSLSHGAHIVVGTPGRVLRLLKIKALSFKNTKTVTLDEADRMLDMGFYDDIIKIVGHLPEQRQTLLFSATLPEEISKLGQRLQTNSKTVKVDTSHHQDVIEQTFFQLPSHKDKTAALLKILGHYRPDRFIVFCKTKQICQSVAKSLQQEKIYARAIHGDLIQNERNSVMTMFSQHSLSALVATDVAARGLDIENLEMVINYDLPTSPEIYIHRVGRTARAGKSGTAITLFVSQEQPKVDAISELKHEKLRQDDIKAIAAADGYDLIPSMGTIYISRGKRDRLRPSDIAGTLIGEAKINFQDIGKISITNTTSFVAIKRELVESAIKKLRKAKIKKLSFKVGLLT
ncbi:MAG: ATP-dependent RNA helicase DbpA [Bdellovibrionales bacterium]|jgi:ATP-dependent RNA helicase DbpA|nr:ATP-dependent RNA helicase DbpA [Bdellovibrionales bacterium]MBT3525344.1 ATP-dependent RNA helicase DbpA [Bdellovibrionales bacterium]